MRLLAAALLCTAAAPDQPPAASGVTSRPYGTTRDGTPVQRLVLTNARGTTVGILTFGGIVDEISVRDRRGRFANVVLALPDLAAYEARANFGSIVGRFANRISGGGFVLDGRRVALSPDPAAIVSHGGKPGFGARVWTAEPCRTAGCRSVTLRLTSPDGDNGFPGTLAVAVTYSLTADDTLRIDYAATTDRATVINLTNHSYFNLAGDHRDADGQSIRILAARFTPLDARRVPTGEIRSVVGTPFDLRAAVRIGDRVTADDPQLRIANGFDHNFVLDKPAGVPMPVAARAADPASGRTLEVRTTEPGLQFYTANGFDGTLVGAGGHRIGRRAGYALETQHYPDSPNRPQFPSTVLRAGERFRSTTTYRFGVAPR